MICPHCGSVIPDNSVFCSQCGARITMPHAAGHASAAPAASNSATPAAEHLADLVPEVVPASAGADEETEMPEVPLTGETVVLPKSAVAAAASEEPAQMPDVPLTGETVVASKGAVEDAASAEPEEMPEVPLAGETVVLPQSAVQTAVSDQPAQAAEAPVAEDASAMSEAAAPAAEPEEMPEAPLAGATVVMPEGAADLGSAPEEEKLATEKTMAVPGRAIAEELQQVPAVEERQVPPAVPVEERPAAMPDKRAPERRGYAGYQGLPSDDEPGQTAVGRPVVVPLQTLSGGATPILQVPVNKHDTPDYRANVKRKHHMRPAPAPRTQQQPQFSQTVSRAEYESRSASETYAEAEQDVFSARAQAPRSSVSASSYVAPSSYAEEGQGLEAHARRAENALRNEGQPVRRDATGSRTPLIAGICIAAIAVIAILLVFGTTNGSTTTPDTAATQQTGQDTSTQTEEPPSPVTTAGDVSYNSDTGALTIEKYGFSTTLPKGMTATASSDGTGLELEDEKTSMKVDVWAKANNGGVTLDSASDEALSVNYNSAHVSTLDNWFYVSWTEGTTGHYTREYVNSERLLALEFSWPEESNEECTSIIESMTDAIQISEE